MHSKCLLLLTDQTDGQMVPAGDFSMKDKLLNIADICPGTRTLGPGNRFAIWVQGCPFECPGCIAPDWIPFKVANATAVVVLAEAIIARDNIRGISISGGEPMMQAGRLSGLLRIVREARPELDVIVFSGFTLQQLVWDEACELLTFIDLLIDGQYINKRNDGNGLRGSSNQQFHFLTERLLPYRDEILKRRTGVEFHLLDDGVLMAGIPVKGFTW
jgi:anaerobic ribonucleoside-triphosphate reductase activating protein